MKRIAFAVSLLTLMAFAAPAATGQAPPAGVDRAPRVNNAFLKAYGSCANSKPFKASHRCNYDGRTKFRGTAVFQSKGSPMVVKTCFRIKGPAPLGGRHACGVNGPTKKLALPFRSTGVRIAYTVKFTWFVKGAGAGPFGKAGSWRMKVRP